MTAKLMIREVGAREFTSHNGPFDDLPAEDAVPAETSKGVMIEVHPGEPALSGVDRAIAEGERLCASGNVEAFQVWELRTTRQRVWKLEEVTQ